MKSNILSVLGLGFILVSACMFDSGVPYPGYRAIMPVLGAALLIFSGPGALVNRYVLGNSIMLKIGLISYPLYLWHWPLLAYVHVLCGVNSSVSMYADMLALSFLLAWLTYRLIEVPVRFRSRKPYTVWVLAGLMACVGLIGFSAYQRNGITFRQVAKIKSGLEEAKVMPQQNALSPGCGLQDDDARRIHMCVHELGGDAKFALIGDSKAHSLSFGVLAQPMQKGQWMVMGGPGYPDPLSFVSDSPHHNRNPAFIQRAVEVLKSNQDVKVVVVAVATRVLFDLKTDFTLEDLPSSPNYPDAFKGLNRLVAQLVQSGKKVVLFVDNPTLTYPEQCVVRQTTYQWINDYIPKTRHGCSISLAQHLKLSNQYQTLLKDVQSRHPGKVAIFDSLPILCVGAQGTCESSLNGKSLYGFTDHLSPFGSNEVAKRLVPFVERFLDQAE